MASSKIILFTSKKYKDGTYPICLRLTFERKPSYITITKVLSKEWDKRKGLVKNNHPNYKGINKQIKLKDAEAYDLLLDYDSGRSNYTKDQIIAKLKGIRRTETLIDYYNDYIEETREKHQYNHATSVISMKNNLIKYHRSKELRFATVTPDWLRKFDLHLRRQDKGKRTICNYMNIIRSMYNRGISDGVIGREHYPFFSYKLKMPQSEKIGLDKDEVDRLIAVQLENEPNNTWELTKWTWLLSFAFGGIRSGDVLQMKWKDIKNNRFYYVMNKNNKPLSLPISSLAQRGLDFFSQFKQKSKGYVIPEMCKANLDDPEDIHRKLRNANRLYNRELKGLAEAAEIDKNLTMHIARHSFGNISGDKISPQLLQMIYRHSDIKTTMNYQQHWMNQEKLDDAMDIVMDF